MVRALIISIGIVVVGFFISCAQAKVQRPELAGVHIKDVRIEAGNDKTTSDYFKDRLVECLLSQGARLSDQGIALQGSADCSTQEAGITAVCTASITWPYSAISDIETDTIGGCLETARNTTAQKLVAEFASR